MPALFEQPEYLEERRRRWAVWAYCRGCGWSDPVEDETELELFSGRHYPCGPDESRGPEIYLGKGPRVDE